MPKPGNTDPKDPPSFQPLGMLGTTEKLCERTVLNRLEKAYEERDGLSDSQNGFRKRRSTIHAMKKIVRIVTEARTMGWAKGRYCAVIALGVKNAFNTAGWEHIYRALYGKIPNYLLKVVSSKYCQRRKLVIDTDQGRTEVDL